MTHQFISSSDVDELPKSLHIRAILGSLQDHARSRSVSWYTTAESILDDAESWFREALPKVEHDTTGPVVPVTFWSLSSDGPTSRRRRLGVPSWEDIASNYPEPVRGQMNTLVTTGAELAGGGKLVLWHGDPGTGKTWGLRALASEWREWCDVHYITDPETFFGASSSYMLDVLLSRSRACRGRGSSAWLRFLTA